MILTINECFAGIGSQSAALKRLGIDFKVVGIAEIDKYAIKSYEAIHGPVRNYGDISKIDKLDYADFWTYSFPCQDLSVAGKGKGMIHICNDCGYEWEIEFSEKPICPNCYSKNVKTSRSGLLKEVERLLEKSVNENESPKWLMLENVKNLVGKGNKGLFETWLKRLDDLGYNTYWQVLNAKNYGIPQNRERVFAISIRKDIDTGYVFPEGFDLEVRLKDLLEEDIDEKFCLNQEYAERFLMSLSSAKYPMGKAYTVLGSTVGAGEGTNSRHWVYDTNDNISTLDATMYKQPKQILEPCIARSIGRNPENPSDRTAGAPTEQRLEVNKNGTSNTITTVQKDNYVIEPSDKPKLVGGIGEINFGKQYRQGNRIYDSEAIAMCLNAQPVGNTGGYSYLYKTGFRIRKLTPRECWRLMGFSDLDFFSAMLLDRDAAIKLLIKYKDNSNGIEIMAEAEIMQKTSNSQLYKQAGNSIVVDVLYYLFKNLFVNKPSIDDLVKHAKLENQLTIDEWLGGLT